METSGAVCKEGRWMRGAPLYLARGAVVGFPPHVTTPGKVTTYCITSTQGNKPACALFVTENTKISALNIVTGFAVLSKTF